MKESAHEPTSGLPREYTVLARGAAVGRVTPDEAFEAVVKRCAGREIELDCPRCSSSSSSFDRVEEIVVAVVGAIAVLWHLYNAIKGRFCAGTTTTAPVNSTAAVAAAFQSSSNTTAAVDRNVVAAAAGNRETKPEIMPEPVNECIGERDVRVRERVTTRQVERAENNGNNNNNNNNNNVREQRFDGEARREDRGDGDRNNNNNNIEQQTEQRVVVEQRVRPRRRAPAVPNAMPAEAVPNAMPAEAVTNGHAGVFQAQGATAGFPPGHAVGFPGANGPPAGFPGFPMPPPQYHQQAAYNVANNPFVDLTDPSLYPSLPVKE